MAKTPHFNGVYIQEVPEGPHTITGVETSITAFVGRAVKGKPDDPHHISSFAEYEQRFGGISIDSTMSYAVRDYFLNGGRQAIIIRIHESASPAAISIPNRGDSGLGSPNEILTLIASSPGTWGNHISVLFEGVPMVSQPPLPLPTIVYNIVIRYKEKIVERYSDVGMDPRSLRYLPNVLKSHSAYVLVDGIIGNPSPVSGTYVVTTPGSDGTVLKPDSYTNGEEELLGLNALYKVDLFNLLCIPPPERGMDTGADVYAKGLEICVKKRAVLIVDPKYSWGAGVSSQDSLQNVVADYLNRGIFGTNARNAALYFPLLQQKDPIQNGQCDMFVPCGAVAGVIARTDVQRGIWKAPAGTNARLNTVEDLQVLLTDQENGILNPRGINCLRSFSDSGVVIWGARTMRGNDQWADEFKYLAVRRTALFIEESLYRGTQWAVFEPNGEPLWSHIRHDITVFMQTLFRQGAFQGNTPQEAYFVKCDRETTAHNDIQLGKMNIMVGFAPLRPAEFVIIKIQQITGQTRK